MFEVGDAVFHPVRGAGVVTDIEELRRRGDSREYYRIQLLNPPRTSVMIPVQGAKARGLRRAIRRSTLDQVWWVLRGSPAQLPVDHEARYESVDQKLRSGSPFQIAEAVRDLAWRERGPHDLTPRDRRMYQRGIELLAGEIAATQGADLTDAEAQIRARLQRYMDGVFTATGC